jgi:predicted RND superfamily exporter protein
MDENRTEKVGEQYLKKRARWVIILVVVLTGLFAYNWKNLRFTYEFDDFLYDMFENAFLLFYADEITCKLEKLEAIEIYKQGKAMLIFEGKKLNSNYGIKKAIEKYKSKTENKTPEIQFGRFNDSYKTEIKYQSWDKSIEYFENEKYLKLISKKFGLEAVKNIKEMSKIKLKRKLLNN